MIDSLLRNIVRANILLLRKQFFDSLFNMYKDNIKNNF